MEKLLELLHEIRSDIEYDQVTNLVTGGYFQSLDILNCVTEIEERFDVEIMASDIVPENFDSAEAIWAMVTCKRQEAQDFYDV